MEYRIGATTFMAGSLLVAGALALCALPTPVRAEPPPFAYDSARERPFRTPAVTIRYQEPPPEVPANPADVEPPALELLDLSIEELSQTQVRVPALEQEVTTVSRQESTVGRSPVAVFVVTQEMIRRSGATSIPEVLRMVPGLQVVRIDSNKWSVTVRGFADRFFNRFLLVQIDGRAVYQVINSTVSWDAVDVMLEDVERIEVVRGPGATVWGANAVNGIINIITKRAADTQGGLISSGGGTEERGFTSFRYGGNNGSDLNYRVYGKWFDRDNGFNANGDAQDDWRAGRGGFRMDWTPTECDTITLQGEIFEVHSGRRDFLRPLTTGPDFFFTNTEDEITDGGHLLSRWSRDLGDDSGWSLQAYYDRFDRRSTNQIIDASIDTYDVDFQNHFQLGCNHKVVWGAGYRFYDLHFHPSGFDGGFHVNASDETVDLNRVSAFVQDEMTLRPDELFLTMGIKLSHNDFSNFEYQPTARLLWAPDEQQAAWASFSRAVRTPAYAEHFSRITGVAGPGTSFFTAFPNQEFDSEEMFAYELGYRAQPTDAFSWDLAMFYNKYDDLLVRRLTPVPLMPIVVLPTFPVTTFNGMDGETYGVELSGTLDVTDSWQLYGQYTFLRMQLHADNPVDAAAEAATEGLSPHNQVYLMSSWDMGCNWELDLIGRYVDILPQFVDVPSYIALDLRLGWYPSENLELSVVGQNLTDPHHPEFGSTGAGTLRSPTVELQRGVYGMLRYKW